LTYSKHDKDALTTPNCKKGLKHFENYQASPDFRPPQPQLYQAISRTVGVLLSSSCLLKRNPLDRPIDPEPRLQNLVINSRDTRKSTNKKMKSGNI
jgi:hypothetical protein